MDSRRGLFSSFGALVFLTLTLTLILFLVAGCGVLEKDRRATQLENSSRAYLTALRWGDFAAAVAFLPPDLRADESLLAKFDDLKIIRYEIQGPLVITSHTTATQVVVVEYLFQHNQIARRLTDRQLWQWDDSARAWWLQSGLPDF